MKAAYRLEISRKDEQIIKDKLQQIIGAFSPRDEEELIKDFILFYRSQLHSAFKLGINNNADTPVNTDT